MKALDEHEWGLAIELAMRLVDLDREDPFARSILGFALCYDGMAASDLERYEQGLKEHDKALMFDPRNALFWLRKGASLMLGKRVAEGVQALSEAIELDPDQADPYAGMVDGYVALGEFDAAEGYLRQFLDRFKRPYLDVLLYRVPCGDRTYSCPRFVTVRVFLEGDDVACEHDGLRIYGVGPTLAEAFGEFCEDFDVLYREYVETEDALHPSGVKLAESLKEIVKA